MLPQFVGNSIEVLNSLSRSCVNVAGIVEQGTEDLAEISHLMMEAQMQRLRQELAKSQNLVTA